MRYVEGDYADDRTFVRLREALGSSEQPLHYMAIPPSMFATVAAELNRSGCARGARVIVEKAVRARSRVGARAQSSGQQRLRGG